MKSKKELLGTEVQEKTIKRTKPGKVLHYFLILFGFISLGVGIIGIFLPLVPTTPLILLAAACFLKSSPKLYYWLTKHKTFGTYIKNYLQSGRIPAKSKPYSIAIVWICISISAYFAESLWLRILLLLIAGGVSIHLLLLKTTESADPSTRNTLVNQDEMETSNDI